MPLARQSREKRRVKRSILVVLVILLGLVLALPEVSDARRGGGGFGGGGRGFRGGGTDITEDIMAGMAHESSSHLALSPLLLWVSLLRLPPPYDVPPPDAYASPALHRHMRTPIHSEWAIS